MKRFWKNGILGLMLAVIFLAPLSLSFQKKNGTSFARVDTSIAHAQGASSLSDYKIPACVSLTDGFSLMGCIDVFAYYVFYKPTSFLAYGGAAILDFFVAFSIDDNNNCNNFVENGWKLVRDIANIGFIVALIFAAISLVLDLGVNWKSVIINVVIIGLMINFSLFFCKIVIDASNILARILYNAVAVQDSTGANVATGGAGEKQISRAIVSGADPQKLMANFNNLNSASGTNGTNNDDGAAQFLLLVLISSVVNLIIAWIFASSGFLFTWRVIGLWIAMILSPLAFITYIMPSWRGKSEIGWSKWTDNLISLSFMAPVFIFFLFLIASFLAVMAQGGFFPNALGNSGNVLYDIFRSIVYLCLPVIFIAFLVSKSKKVAQQMAGEGAAMIGNAMAFVGGAALGVATGGASMAMRKTIGAGAASYLEGERGEKLREKAASGDKMAQLRLKTLEGAKNSTFDVRNIKVGSNSIASMTGLKTGTTGTKKTYESVKNEKKEQEKKYLEKKLLVQPTETLARAEQDARRNKVNADLRDEELRKATITGANATTLAQIRTKYKDIKGNVLTGTVASYAAQEVLAKQAVADENRRRRHTYANTVEASAYHRYWIGGSEETADEMRRGVKSKGDKNETPEEFMKKFFKKGVKFDDDGNQIDTGTEETPPTGSPSTPPGGGSGGGGGGSSYSRGTGMGFMPGGGGPTASGSGTPVMQAGTVNVYGQNVQQQYGGQPIQPNVSRPTMGFRGMTDMDMNQNGETNMNVGDGNYRNAGENIDENMGQQGAGGQQGYFRNISTGNPAQNQEGERTRVGGFGAALSANQQPPKPERPTIGGFGATLGQNRNQGEYAKPLSMVDDRDAEMKRRLEQSKRSPGSSTYTEEERQTKTGDGSNYGAGDGFTFGGGDSDFQKNSYKDYKNELGTKLGGREDQAPQRPVVNREEAIPQGYRVVDNSEILPAGDYDTHIDVTTGRKITNAPRSER